ncbi:MAG: hypothetical protein AAGA90_21135 [Actinomycetota bacterium]
MPAPTTDDERLVDLVVCLSGSSGQLARRALDAADPGALAHDPLAAVAAALVALRHPESPMVESETA